MKQAKRFSYALLFCSKAQVVEENTVMITLTVNDNKEKKHFHGLGSNKKLAKNAAAKLALKYFGKDIMTSEMTSSK